VNVATVAATGIADSASVSVLRAWHRRSFIRKPLVWVYARSGGVWTRQGSPLAGTGAGLIAPQGWAVALSSDGETAIVGGPDDNVTFECDDLFAYCGEPAGSKPSPTRPLSASSIASSCAVKPARARSGVSPSTKPLIPPATFSAVAPATALL
jgi:hypothetical protein